MLMYNANDQRIENVDAMKTPRNPQKMRTMRKIENAV